ncbi:YheT family hydrolase [Methylophilus sp. Leaf414]|uniref:YheT family hydrolase n=1 Tax=Methylophilus sp. Leaf414 TaxID=1736371 RepID=UPI0009EA5369|nr:alpha/beta fold hydrolase [Methylophilus sp. Leaf414]
MKQLFLLVSLLFSCDYLTAAPYSAPFWLPGGDLQTIFAATLNPVPNVDYRRERWELPDGDFVDADWVDNAPENHAASPIVVLFHGLEGNSQSAYARALMAAVKAKGWRGVVIHFRGCSGEPNRLPRVYYAGDAPEIDLFLSRVRSHAPSVPIYAVGVSLGGNALLKWLGEKGDKAAIIIDKAIAVSAPIDLAASADSLDKGLNRLIYTPMFVDSMRPKALEMTQRFPGLLSEEKIKAAKTIHDIDNAVTAVLYGATDAEDYYAKNASKPWLASIRLPTLILNAKNDPFIPASSLPTADEVSGLVTLEYPDTGGHAGFPRDNNWFATHLLEFFQAEHLSASD